MNLSQGAEIAAIIMVLYPIAVYILRAAIKDAVRKEFGKQTKWWISRLDKLDKRFKDHIASRDAHHE